MLRRLGCDATQKAATHKEAARPRRERSESPDAMNDGDVPKEAGRDHQQHSGPITSSVCLKLRLQLWRGDMMRVLMPTIVRCCEDFDTCGVIQLFLSHRHDESRLPSVSQAIRTNMAVHMRPQCARSCMLCTTGLRNTWRFGACTFVIACACAFSRHVDSSRCCFEMPYILHHTPDVRMAVAHPFDTAERLKAKRNEHL